MASRWRAAEYEEYDSDLKMPDSLTYFAEDRHIPVSAVDMKTGVKHMVNGSASNSQS